MIRLWVGCPGIVVQFLAEAKDFSLLPSLEMDSGVHPAPCSFGTGDFFQTSKAVTCETGHLLPSSARM
jgi:hypothetical protein